MPQTKKENTYLCAADMYNRIEIKALDKRRAAEQLAFTLTFDKRAPRTGYIDVTVSEGTAKHVYRVYVTPVAHTDVPVYTCEAVKQTKYFV